jgi:hypothetical protein
MKSHQEPAVYNLEYFGDALFWEGAGDSRRRALLMPLSNPSEFLAFGVFGSSDTVHFVARGRVREHLGDFIARMAEAAASVELYERVPLPWSLVKRYTSDDPFDGEEVTPPKESSNGGRIALPGGMGAPTGNPVILSISENPIWPSPLDGATREVFIMSLPGHETFLAMGVCTPPAPAQSQFVFVATGQVAGDLGDFIARMKQAGASVKLCDWPPLSILQQYVTTAYPGAFTERSTAPSNGKSTVPTSQQVAA